MVFINANTQNVKLLLLVSECRFGLGLMVRVNDRKRYVKCLRNEFVCVCVSCVCVSCVCVCVCKHTCTSRMLHQHKNCTITLSGF